MKAAIVTQDEPFYLSVFMSKVLAEYRRVIAVVIVPGPPKGVAFLSYVRKLYDVFGLRDFFAYGVLFIHHKIADLLSYWKQIKRLCSVKSVDLRNSILVYGLRNINEPDSMNFLKALAAEED